MTDDAELMRVLAGLREQYLAEAPERLAALRDAVDRARTGDDAALPELRLLLHRLAGSGGSYGLQAVTDAARAAEQEVHGLLGSPSPLPMNDATRLLDLVERVAIAFRASGAAV